MVTIVWTRVRRSRLASWPHGTPRHPMARSKDQFTNESETLIVIFYNFYIFFNTATAARKYSIKRAYLQRSCRLALKSVYFLQAYFKSKLAKIFFTVKINYYEFLTTDVQWFIILFIKNSSGWMCSSSCLLIFRNYYFLDSFWKFIQVLSRS